MEKLALYSVLQPRVPVMDTDDSSCSISEYRHIEDSDDDGDDKTIYIPPSHQRMQSLAALLLPRAGERPLQAVEQALLAGSDCDFEAQTNKEVMNLKSIVSVHDLELLRMSREREFKDQGVEVSTTLLANFRGTPEAAQCPCFGTCCSARLGRAHPQAGKPHHVEEPACQSSSKRPRGIQTYVSERKHQRPQKRASRLLERREEARPQAQKREGRRLQSRRHDRRHSGRPQAPKREGRRVQSR
jgi:hypothetical protein